MSEDIIAFGGIALLFTIFIIANKLTDKIKERKNGK